MKRSLRTLEALQASLSNTSGDASGSNAHATLEERRAKEAAKARQIAKLSPYKRAEYVCLECVAELRDALRTIEELQYTTHGTAPSASSGSSSGLPLRSASREESEAREGDEDAEEEDDESVASDERAQLLGGRGGRRRRPGHAPPKRHSGEAAVLYQALLQARQRARRAHQRLQQLQREAARLSRTSSVAAAPAAAAAAGWEAASIAEASTAPKSSAALEALDWQRAEKHVEAAKRWYREVFGIYVVSSTGAGTAASPSSLQLSRPAQPHQSAGSMSHFGRGANPLPGGVASAAGGIHEEVGSVERSGTGKARTATRTPTAAETEGREHLGGDATEGASPSQVLMLRSAREDAEFQAFFASVQANDELMDAALDRLSEGVARLLDNARGMQDELTVQDALLQGTETRIDRNEADIANMNRRLRRAIRDMEDSSICVYVVCLMVLLLILGVLLRVAG